MEQAKRGKYRESFTLLDFRFLMVSRETLPTHGRVFGRIEPGRPPSARLRGGSPGFGMPLVGNITHQQGVIEGNAAGREERMVVIVV